MVHGTYSVNLSCPIYQMDHGGRVVQTLTTLPTGYRPMDMVMDGDNRTIRVLAFDLNRSQIAVVDVAPGGAVTTAATWSGPMPSAMLRTDDGDWIVLSQLMAQRPVTYLYQLSGSSVTSLAHGWGILAYAATWDPDQGDIVVRGRGPDTFGTTLWGYYKIDRTTGAVSTITAYPEKGEWPAAVGARHPPWRAIPGTFVDLVWDGKQLSSFLAHVHPERGALTCSAVFPGLQVSDLVCTSQRNLPVAYVGLVQDAPIPASRYLAYFTEDGRPASLRKLSGTPALISGTRCLRIGSRHLAWFMNAPPNGRSLKLDFPSEGGRPYVVAFGHERHPARRASGGWADHSDQRGRLDPRQRARRTRLCTGGHGRLARCPGPRLCAGGHERAGPGAPGPSCVGGGAAAGHAEPGRVFACPGADGARHQVVGPGWRLDHASGRIFSSRPVLKERKQEAHVWASCFNSFAPFVARGHGGISDSNHAPERRI